MTTPVSAGSVRVERDGEEIFVPGWISLYRGVSPEAYLKDLRGKAKPEHDYFVFSSHDPLHPEQSSVFVLVSPAKNVDQKKTQSKFNLFAKNELGTLAEIPNLSFHDWIDHRWTDPLQHVSVDSSSSRVASSIRERLLDKFEGKPASPEEVRGELKTILTELEEICWGIEEVSIGREIHLKATAAPETVSLHGLPPSVQEEAMAWLDREMQAIYERHPVIVSRRLSEVEGHEKFPLRKGNSDDETFWAYPSNTPQLQEEKNPISDKLAGLVAGKTPDSVPSPAPGGRMPIPKGLFGQFLAWLSERLETEPGLFGIDWRIEKGGIRLAARRTQRPQFVLTPGVLEELKREIGDFREEAKLLEQGTTNWSARQIKEFTERLERRFIASGFELKTDHPKFLTNLPDGRISINPYYTPLIRSKDIRFSGDLELKGIGGEGVLRQTLGNQPMTRAELRKQLGRIEDHYHRQGYLLIGENPSLQEGVQLPLISRPDGSLEVPIKVVRIGRVSVNGDVPRPNREALAQAIRFTKGEPFHQDRFRGDAQRAMIRLGLIEGGEPAYVLRSDGSLDVTLRVTRQEPMLNFNIGGNDQGLITAVSGSLPNMIPGLTEAAASVHAGFADTDDISHLGAHVSGTTVPLTKGGTRLSVGTGLSTRDYRFYDDTGRLAESGNLDRLDGSFMVRVPLGRSIASPLELRVGIHGSVEWREGTLSNDDSIDATNQYVGESAGINAIYDRILVPGDLLQADLSVGLDHNLTLDSGDLTVKGSLTYSIPISRSSALETTFDAAKRSPVYGGPLPPERLFGPGQIPRIDFGRGFSDSYGDDSYWNTGLFWVLTYSRIFQPMIGATIAGDGRGGLQGGAGLALRIPIVGLVIYWSPMLNQDLANHVGVSAAARLEF